MFQRSTLSKPGSALAAAALALLVLACGTPSRAPGNDVGPQSGGGDSDAVGPSTDARDAASRADVLPIADDFAADDFAADDAPDNGNPSDDSPSFADDANLFDMETADIRPDATADVIRPQCEGALLPFAHQTDATATFVRGPYLQSVLADRAVVVWRDAPDSVAEGCVTYHQGDGPARETCALPDAFGQYAVTLTDLLPGEIVSYAVNVGERGAGPFVFHAAPDEAAPVRLLVFADAHANVETLDRIGRAALQAGVHLAVSVGDAVSEPQEDQWDRFFQGVNALAARVPLFSVIGNHEGMSSTYFEAFVLPEAAQPPTAELWYDVRWGTVWMGMLEYLSIAVPAALGQPGPEIEWLKARLASPQARSARWRLLFLHEPAYSQGWAPCDRYHGEAILRTTLLPLAAEYGVSVIFSGHTHGWERGQKDGVVLVTTGGGGGALDDWCEPDAELPQPWVTAYVHHKTLVDADCDRLVIEARDLDDQLIDHVEIE